VTIISAVAMGAAICTRFLARVGGKGKAAGVIYPRGNDAGGKSVRSITAQCIKGQPAV